MRIKINRDMDHAGMSEMQTSFDALGRGPDDVCLDLSQVQFLDSAGVDGLDSLFETLRRRSLNFSIVHAEGQPLHLLRRWPAGYGGPEWARRLA
jgi:stage II sporulation protein AA (anti-sigma F factor antagonist)